MTARRPAAGPPGRGGRGSPQPGGPGAGDRSDPAAARVAAVRGRIAAAAERAGRDPAGVTLVAVAKLHPVEAVRAAIDAGVTDVGENYAQELQAKAAALEGTGVRWHFVGRLQRNKAAVVVGVRALVHSLTSLPLAEALGRHAHAAGTVARALVQVELDERPAAHGVRPADLDGFVAAARAVEGLDLAGLMVMPAPTPDPGDARPVFRRAAALARDLGLGELSMGMTADLEVAVEEGATLVRVGTAVFGPRPEERQRPRRRAGPAGERG
jgi:pyridoxal phosphate enzyme (YggS family)